MVASMPAWASRPVSMAAKPGRELFDRAGMHIVILVPPAPGLGFTISLATGCADALAAAEPLAPGLVGAAALAAGLALVLAATVALVGALAAGTLGDAVPPQLARSSAPTAAKNEVFRACFMRSDATA
jgi:hypothetical protein